jgi:hypothetical protein
MLRARAPEKRAHLELSSIPDCVNHGANAREIKPISLLTVHGLLGVFQRQRRLVDLKHLRQQLLVQQNRSNAAVLLVLIAARFDLGQHKRRGI